MEELIGRITAAAGIDAALATKAIGMILNFLKKEGPPAEVEPDNTINKLLPIDITERLTLCLAPSPTASINTTAATPMIMPSIVNAVRSRFAPNARQASPRVANGFMGDSPVRHEPLSHL